jgi:hypothetical protein
MKGLESSLLFRIGKSKKKHTFPIYEETEQKSKVNIGFIEIGCTPNSKRAQLLDKREKFSEIWNDEFGKYGINWVPDIRRTLLHYDPEMHEKGVFNRFAEYNPDVVIFYNRITDEDLEKLSDKQRRRIMQSDSPDRRKLLLDILNRNSAEDLQDMILSEKYDCKMASLRGRSGEIVGQNRIKALLPEGITLVKNGELKYFREQIRDESEIDGVLIYYQPELYWKLIQNLQRSKNLTVEVNWDIVSPSYIEKNKKYKKQIH